MKKTFFSDKINLSNDISKSHWNNLQGSSNALAISDILKSKKQFCIVVTKDSFDATRLQKDVSFFLKDDGIDILHLPDWETLPYDHFSPHRDIISERVTTLSRIPHLEQGLLIIPITTLLHRLPEKRFLEKMTFVLKCGDLIDSEKLRLRLQNTGYNCVEQVMEHGEFAIRGSIIDLFPMGNPYPYRIDLFDDEVESIRVFDPESQRSSEKMSDICLLPAKEFPFDDEAITLFRNQWRDTFSGNPINSTIYQDVSQGITPSGIEYYLPLFFKETETLFDFIPDSSLFFLHAGLSDAANDFIEQCKFRYEQLRGDITRPLLKPEKLFIPFDHVLNKLDNYSIIYSELATNHIQSVNFETKEPPHFEINHKAEQPLQPIIDLNESEDERILFCVESAGRREVLINLLNQASLKPKHYHDWHDFIDDDEKLGIVITSLSQGLWLPQSNIIVITEQQLFGEHVLQQRRRTKAREYDPETIIKNLAELQIDSPIVHYEHGIGRYKGLETLEVGDVTNEFLVIDYANDDKLYVPISSLHLISRYSGSDRDHAPIHRLGSDQWEKAKQKAAKRIRDIAAELLEIHAKREAEKGKICEKGNEHYQQFAQDFPFEETPDQQQAIEDVIHDLTSNKKMDRLVCGDVGFGKTEVAMRAAFIAVQSGFQVAILTPTTLLAQQHYENFCDRFADWPIKIDILSRFRTKKEQEDTSIQVAHGKVDIIIGTHRLLQKDIRFTNLGLLVIDEEHRFGVTHKERIKALRSDINILTLTATPIPRTLNMAMGSLRDLSIIATPPAKRLAIKTFVHKHDDITITEAIRRELLRGGQIYYLHNKVQTIEKTTQKIAELIPEARIQFAHGQMRERELEKIMSDFYHQRFNVLVCTTIIESGIDIPTANTIIIDRADHFGLAELHQLRGRVGRSHHQAYAYLLIPDKKLITKDAEKRLDAISSLEDLGSGFMLATHDLEIRGAGELLGGEQSGHMQEIGFTLYLELLEKAVQSLKKGETIDFDQKLHLGTEIDLKVTAIIPEDYLPDIHSRLILYKRIANAKSDNELDELQVEMIDRFGLLPDATKHLFEITLLKLKTNRYDINKITSDKDGITMNFNENPNIEPAGIISLIQNEPKNYKLTSNHSLRIIQKTKRLDEKIKLIESVLNKLKIKVH